MPPPQRLAAANADGDGIDDTDDPLPFLPGVISWPAGR